MYPTWVETISVNEVSRDIADTSPATRRIDLTEPTPHPPSLVPGAANDLEHTLVPVTRRARCRRMHPQATRARFGLAHADERTTHQARKERARDLHAPRAVPYFGQGLAHAEELRRDHARLAARADTRRHVLCTAKGSLETESVCLGRCVLRDGGVWEREGGGELLVQR